jgi:hypothetical protein
MTPADQAWLTQLMSPRTLKYAFHKILGANLCHVDRPVNALRAKQQPEERDMGPVADLSRVDTVYDGDQLGSRSSSSPSDDADRFILVKSLIASVQRASQAKSGLTGSGARTFLRSMCARAEEVIGDIEDPAVRRDMMSELTGVALA